MSTAAIGAPRVGQAPLMTPNPSAPDEGASKGCADRVQGPGGPRDRGLRARIAARAYSVDGAQVAAALMRRSAALPVKGVPPELRRCAPEMREGPARTADMALADRLALARAQLQMDVAVLGEILGEREVVRRAIGEWPGLDDVAALEGARIDLVDSFCRHLLTGRLPDVVSDVQDDPRTRDLPAATEGGVGAWIGVPLRTSPTRLYVLCCLARDRRPGLGPREAARLRRHAAAVGLILELRRSGLL